MLVQGPEKSLILPFVCVRIIEAHTDNDEAQIGGHMIFLKKLEKALAKLESSEPKISGYQPPLFRLLWVLGVELPPPHFRTFSKNRTFFGAVAGIWMWILFASWTLFYVGMPWTSTLLISTPAGLFVGILGGHYMAKHYEKEAKLYKIPQWKDFQPEE